MSVPKYPPQKIPVSCPPSPYASHTLRGAPTQMFLPSPPGSGWGRHHTAAHRPLSVVAFILGCSSHLFSFVFLSCHLRHQRVQTRLLWVTPAPIT